jgi:2-keto-3-deoxy-L-rhamnonate aldolase RhmA
MTTSPFENKRNRVLVRLEKGETPLGMQMFTKHPDLIEIVGYAGFDFVMIDMEHSRVNPETMVNCIRAAEASGLAPIIRVTENNPGYIRAAVESGAQGVIVPHVLNAASAKKAIDALRYPPEGKCGICPSIRAAYYQQDLWEEYMAYANNNVMFVPLLEDVEAIESAEEIIALLKPGRDAVGLGLADISNSLLTKPGERVQWQHPYLKEAFDKVMALTKKADIPIMGMAWPRADLESAKAVLANGTKILLFFPDHHFWYNMCRDIIREMRGLVPQPV